MSKIQRSTLPNRKLYGSSPLRITPAECVLAVLRAWCPNPAQTSCLRVQGDAMSPTTCDGYIVGVDSSQNDHALLDGKIVIAWNIVKGLTLFRFRRYGNTEVLQPENSQYESVTLNKTSQWQVLAKVLWWTGKVP